MKTIYLKKRYFYYKKEFFEKNDVNKKKNGGVIHFLYNLGKKNEEIHLYLIDVYKDNALSLKVVEYWTH